jgi:Ca2+/H+ antiporter
MISVAVRRKEQSFNAKSAGVTSTMLIMAIIGTLTPTLFYQTYGNVSIPAYMYKYLWIDVRMPPSHYFSSFSWFVKVAEIGLHLGVRGDASIVHTSIQTL